MWYYFDVFNGGALQVVVTGALQLFQQIVDLQTCPSINGSIDLLTIGQYIRDVKDGDFPNENEHY